MIQPLPDCLIPFLKRQRAERARNDAASAPDDPEPEADKDVPDEGDAGVLPAIPGLRLNPKYTKLGELCTHPTQPEWWTEADGRRKNNVLYIYWHKGVRKWRIELDRLGNGNGEINCASFAGACARAMDPNPPEPYRCLRDAAMDDIDIPPCPEYLFAPMIPDLLTGMASHLFVYEACNGGTLLARKGSATRGAINERACKQLWIDLDSVKHSCKAPEKTRDCNGNERGNCRAAYDFTAVVKDADGKALKSIKVELKLARMSFDTDHQRWVLQFDHVKPGLSHEVWLVFEGFDGLHVVVWNDEKGYSTQGVREATVGGQIKVFGPVGMTDPQEAHDVLRDKLYTEFAHPDRPRMPVIKYTDARYKEIFEDTSDGEALYETVPMGSLQMSVRGAMHERVARWVLTMLGHTVTDAPRGGTNWNGDVLGANATEFDFCIDKVERGECKSALMIFSFYGGDRKGEWIIRFIGIKSLLHDVLILVFHGPTGLHIWEYGDNDLSGQKTDKDGNSTNQVVKRGAGVNVPTAEKAEEALLKKLAHSDKNTYLARVAFAEGDYETFEDALEPFRDRFTYTPTEIGTVKYNPKECGDDDDNDDSDDDEPLYCPSSMR